MRRTAAALLALTLWAAAGCAPQADLAADAAANLQAAVADVVSAAEQGRYEAAREALGHAREVLVAAADDGQLSVARYRQIDEALARTEAELDAVVQEAAERAAVEQAAAEQAAAEQAAAEQAAAEQAAAEQAAAEQAAAEQAATERADPPGKDGSAGKPGRGKGGKGEGGRD